MNKKIRAVLSPEAKDGWDELNRVVAEEIEKDVTNSFNQQLFKSVKRVKELIETNKFYAIRTVYKCLLGHRKWNIKHIK